MNYYDMPKYWFITKKFLNQHPNVVDLIWPQGLSPDEYLGEFYHVSHTHPNASFLALLLSECETKHINRNEMYFPTWNRARARSPELVSQ